jgi:DnaJ-class molecular chaperone
VAEREWFDKDYYKLLGLSSSATDKEVTRAYRKLAKELHPDTNPGSEEKFKEVSVAYDVLGDAAKRKEYDEVRRLGPAAPAPVASTSRPVTSVTSATSSVGSSAEAGASAPSAARTSRRRCT